MISLIEHIVKTAPITFEDNYQTRLFAREKILSSRRNKLDRCRSRGSIEYDADGIATKFYPAIHYRKDFKRLDSMIKVIDKELSEISKYL